MKAFLTTFFLIGCFAITLTAQQEAILRHYQLNQFIVNPAVAGTTQKHTIRIGYRQHWNTFPGAPTTISATYHKGLALNTGVGVLLYSDRIANIQRFGAKAAFAYHLGLTEKMKLSFGLAGKMEHYGLDSKELLNLIDQNDDVVINAIDGSNTFDLDFGMYLYHDNFYFGVSAVNVLQSNIHDKTDEFNLVAQLYRQFSVLAGYKLQRDNFSVEPSFLARQVQGTAFDFEAHVKVGFLKDQIFIGAGYGGNSSATALVAARFDQKFLIGYSFDYYFSPIHDYKVQSHELTFGVDF